MIVLSLLSWSLCIDHSQKMGLDIFIHNRCANNFPKQGQGVKAICGIIGSKKTKRDLCLKKERQGDDGDNTAFAFQSCSLQVSSLLSPCSSSNTIDLNHSTGKSKLNQTIQPLIDFVKIKKTKKKKSVNSNQSLS